MKKTTLNHHLIRVMKIKEKNYEKWEFLILIIRNALQNRDTNSRDAAFLQILANIPMFDYKMRKYTLKQKLYLKKSS